MSVARLVCSVQDDHLLVTVVAVDKREDGVVYESAIARLSVVAAALAKGLRAKLNIFDVGHRSATGRPARRAVGPTEPACARYAAVWSRRLNGRNSAADFVRSVR